MPHGLVQGGLGRTNAVSILLHFLQQLCVYEPSSTATFFTAAGLQLAAATGSGTGIWHSGAASPGNGISASRLDSKVSSDESAWRSNSPESPGVLIESSITFERDPKAASCNSNDKVPCLCLA
jgi:hypothetical protein